MLCFLVAFPFNPTLPYNNTCDRKSRMLLTLTLAQHQHRHDCKIAVETHTGEAQSTTPVTCLFFFYQENSAAGGGILYLHVSVIACTRYSVGWDVGYF